MSDCKLGELIDETAQRDATHIAIAPVVAGEPLTPGEHIGFADDGRVAAKDGFLGTAPLLGIVDPFLKKRVRTGQRFFMFLYPQTVTGMRHHWAHPAFKEALAVVPASGARDPEGESRRWLESFCAEHNAPFNDLIEGVKEFVESKEEWGNRYVQQGSESLRSHGASPEFWQHFATYTGMFVPPEKIGENPFCCTC